MTSLVKPEKINWDDMEQATMEVAIPAHMMYVSAQSVTASGYILRADVVTQLNRAAAAPFAQLAKHPLRIKRAATRVDQVVLSALNHLSPFDNLHAFYTSCMFALVLVDEGLLADPQNVAVLNAMLVMDDIKEAGITDTYQFKSQLLQMEAKKILTYVQKEGFYKISDFSKNPSV